MLMMGIGIHCILLRMSMICPIFIDLNILQHSLSVKLVSCLGINIGINQHLRPGLVLQMNCTGRSCRNSRVSKMLLLMLHLTFT